MEADKLFLEEISDFLGPKKNRYFANGFKGIDISYHEVTYQNGVFRAAIQVNSGNGWSKKKGQSLTPHLGTTEFISIAAAVSQQLMEKELQLSMKAIECSWISRFTCKIKQCENIDCHHIPLSGSLFSTRVNEDNMYEYGFKVQIGSLLITLYVCSPRKFIPDEMDSSGKIDVYTTGYKLHTHTITNVIIDGKEMKASGTVHLFDENQNKKGLGANYSGLLLTDFILITGQLTQSLLYHLNHIDRADSHTMWLREVDVRCETPTHGMIYDSQVQFMNVNLIHSKDSYWQSVELLGTVGHIHAKIKVALQIN